MGVITMKGLVMMVLCVLVSGQVQPKYSDHAPIQPVFATQTITLTDTVTLTHTLRETTTTDVWGTEYEQILVTGTQYVTDYDFTALGPRTYTSVIRVTSTPVTFVTATVMINSILTETSAFTSFFTTVQTVDFVQSITHVAIAHQVLTVPVISTQMLHQQIITTVTQLVASTLTSTTVYGQHF